MWSLFLAHLCKMMISRRFLHFFKILTFWVVSVCHTPLFQEAYIWSWFLVHMCKMKTSVDVFFIFFKLFIFQVIFQILCFICIWGTIPHMIVVFGTRVKWWYLQHSFSFSQNFDFVWFLWWGDKGQNMTHNYQFRSYTLHLKKCRSYH